MVKTKNCINSCDRLIFSYHIQEPTPNPIQTSCHQVICYLGYFISFSIYYSHLFLAVFHVSCYQKKTIAIIFYECPKMLNGKSFFCFFLSFKQYQRVWTHTYEQGNNIMYGTHNPKNFVCRTLRDAIISKMYWNFFFSTRYMYVFLSAFAT